MSFSSNCETPANQKQRVLESASGGKLRLSGLDLRFVGKTDGRSRAKQRDLIYDIGLHLGDDAHFYLLKGYRVVGVEADPQLCDVAAERLRQFVETGQLVIENVAIAEEPGTVTFFRNVMVGWGTIVPKWNRQNAVRGCPSTEISVQAITLGELVGRHGPAFYMKIDIEGMDRPALASLRGVAEVPLYISIESSFPREPIGKVRDEFDALAALGYDRFKIIRQDTISGQQAPAPALPGESRPFTFGETSSGLFGEETPGEWLSYDEALKAFRAIGRRDWFSGLLHRNMRIAGLYGGTRYKLTGAYAEFAWYDIHARHSSVTREGR